MIPGNRLGWSIAAGLGVLLASVAWQLAGLNRLTPPTNMLSDALVFSPLKLEVPADAVFTGDAAGDPTALYREAIADIRANPERYAAVERSDAADAFAKTPAGRAILTAGPMAAPVHLADDVATWGGYGGPTEDLAALDLAGRLLMRAGLLYRDKDKSQSRATFEAAFALGMKMFDERARYAEAAVGLSIAREATAGLLQLAERDNDARRVGLLTTFDRAAAGLQDRRLTPLWRAVGALDGALIARHAGDVAALASPRTVERMWRAEAALALGRHRYSLDRDADRLAAPRRLKALAAGEPEPLVHAAIRAAEALTIEQYRTLR